MDRDLNGTGTFDFGPVIDDYASTPFLPEHPLATLKAGRQKDVPLITGTNDGDGSIFVALQWDKLPWLSANFSLYAPKLLFDSRPFQITPTEQVCVIVVVVVVVGGGGDIVVVVVVVDVVSGGDGAVVVDDGDGVVVYRVAVL